MPSHPERVRRNYESDSVHYFPCDRYTEHVIVNGKCFMCKKTEEEIIKELNVRKFEGPPP